MSETLATSRRSPAWTVVRALILLVILGAGAYMLFCNLGELRIIDYDEARHGVNAYEMIRNDDYLVSTYNGENDYFNLKPPLSYWSIVLSYKLFGYNAFALRFHSALSMLLCMLLMSYWLLKRFGWMPMLVAMAFLVCNSGVYAIHFARAGDADAQYQLFFTIAMLCMMLSRDNFRWLYGSALCFALAFMDKALHALAIPFVCLLYVICTGLWRKLNWKRVLLLMAWGLTPILIWGVARYTRDGTVFFEKMLFSDVVGRVGNNAIGDTSWGDTIFGTFRYFMNDILSRKTTVVGLVLCCLCGVVCIVKEAKPDRRSKDVLIGASIWFAAPILMYCVMKTQFLWYVFHVFMALPVLIAVMLRTALGSGGKQIPLKIAVGLCCALLCTYAWSTMQYVDGIRFSASYQEKMTKYLQRDADEGLHAYIQYNENKGGKEGAGRITEWMPADRLCAYFSGDVVCVDGGAEAFLEDEESALLIIGRDNNLEVVDEVSGYTMPRYEGGMVLMLDK